MRLFIAVDLPRELKERIGEALAPVRSLPGSWSKPAAYHLTLAFLGEQDPSLRSRLESLMKELLRDAAPFGATLAGTGFFPDSGHARVGWIGVESGGRLESIAESLRVRLRQEGFETGRGDFSPHLTLVRPRRQWKGEEIKGFGTAASGLSGSRFLIDRVHLFSSQLKQEGAVHTVLATVRLEGS